MLDHYLFVANKCVRGGVLIDSCVYVFGFGIDLKLLYSVSYARNYFKYSAVGGWSKKHSA